MASDDLCCQTHILLYVGVKPFGSIETLFLINVLKRYVLLTFSVSYALGQFWDSFGNILMVSQMGIVLGIANV
jgi:hypothetical protein